MASLVAAFLAVWSCPARAVLAGAAAVLFVVGLLALLAVALKQVRQTLTDPKLSPPQRCTFAAMGLVMLVIVNLPLLWSGSQWLR